MSLRADASAGKRDESSLPRAGDENGGVFAAVFVLPETVRAFKAKQ